MRTSLLIVCLFVACGDNRAPRLIDAAADAVPDARPDAGLPKSCFAATDCPGLYCCVRYSPGGAFGGTWCTIADGTCNYFLCDPNVPGPCVKPFNKTGTCMYTRLNYNDQTYYWACI